MRFVTTGWDRPVRRLIVLALVLALLSPACASHDHSESGSDAETTEGTIPGSPANASEADRDIAIDASDELRFSPSSVELDSGEVVTFVVHNGGQTDHEFVLGDEAYQKAHESDMTSGHHMTDSENAVTVGPGETKELTWSFTDTGELLYGCHEPGHYDGGMVGTIEVG